jgi:hypothetical protein
VSAGRVIDRDRVRALVRAELEKRLAPAPAARGLTVAALLEIHPGAECSEDPDYAVRRPCVIEPHRPCINSGYCKKLGY